MSTFTTYEKGPIMGPNAAVKDFANTTNLSVYQAETTQRFMLGTRYITWDGRVYKYALADGTLTPNEGCRQNRPQEISYAAIVSGALGALYLKCTVGATDGVSGDGDIAENALAGGYFVIFDNTSADNPFMRGILGNTLTDGGGEMTIDFDVALHLLLTTNDIIEGHCSPYYKVKSGDWGFIGVCGVPTIPAISGQYTWLQTWGVIWISPQTEVGNGRDKTQCIFRHDGSIGMHMDSAAQGGTTYNYPCQHAGFVLTTAQAHGQGAPLIMLQISI